MATLLTRRGLMAWIAVGVSFLVLDLIWLGIIGRPIYAELMGDLLRPEAYVPAAAIFYVFFVTNTFTKRFHLQQKLANKILSFKLNPNY